MAVVTGRARIRDLALEGFVSCGAAAAMTLVCTNIKVDPKDRVGQVSGIASIEFRYMLLAVPIVVVMIVAARWRSGAAFENVSRLGCAAVAGLASGFVAGGIIVALRGTSLALGGMAGDSEIFALTSEALRNGTDETSVYPPLSLHVLSWYADILGKHSIYALKHLQIAGTALLGPTAYLAWRLFFSPRWALVIGVIAALPLIEAAPLKPYAPFVLFIFIPVIIRLLQVLRHVDKRDVIEVVRCGVAFGLVLGVLCILYTGWFKWSAPGIVVTGLVVFPWRRAFRKGVLLVGVVGVCFALVSGAYLHKVATNAGELDDDFMYFDTTLEPAYIGMYGGDAAPTYVWPPRGEVGGVGLFTVLLVIGFGVAIALGRSRTIVIALTTIITGAWLLRFWYAHLMYKTKLVQLWPRTTAELLYCLLLCCGLAAYFIVERLQERAGPDSVARSSSAHIAVVAAMIFLLGSSGSAIADRYMPAFGKGMSYGIHAWFSHGSAPP